MSLLRIVSEMDEVACSRSSEAALDEKFQSPARIHASTEFNIPALLRNFKSFIRYAVPDRLRLTRGTLPTKNRLSAMLR